MKGEGGSLEPIGTLAVCTYVHSKQNSSIILSLLYLLKKVGPFPPIHVNFKVSSRRQNGSRSKIFFWSSSLPPPPPPPDAAAAAKRRRRRRRRLEKKSAYRLRLPHVLLVGGGFFLFLFLPARKLLCEKRMARLYESVSLVRATGSVSQFFKKQSVKLFYCNFIA